MHARLMRINPTPLSPFCGIRISRLTVLNNDVLSLGLESPHSPFPLLFSAGSRFSLVGVGDDDDGN